MELEPIIGLEIHIKLKTQSKMFCSCPNVSDQTVAVNSAVCPICLGHPGTLPAVNQQAIKLATQLALAVNCKINTTSTWARKHYFYPDLPKGYQISQYQEPLAEHGHLAVKVDGLVLPIGITRIHLEEDAAKIFRYNDKILVDFNRCGTPLAEIVTEPDFRSPEQAKDFLQELRLLARYLGVSDADMEKGQLRCDANISLRPIGDDNFYAKTEIKNLNSFKAVERAMKYEISRQTKLWNAGDPEKIQSTRGWDDNKCQTILQRTKEEAADYRYYCDPDLPPLVLSVNEIDKWQKQLPELPNAKRERFINEYALNQIDTNILIDDKNLADYFEKVISEARGWLETLDDELGTSAEIWQRQRSKLTRLACAWMQSELFKLMNESGQKITKIKITPENFAEFLSMIYQRRVNSSSGQILLRKMFLTGGDPSDIIENDDLKQVSDGDALAELVDNIIIANPDQVAQYRAGKTVVLKYLFGLAMRQNKGRADPQLLEEILKTKLDR
jgi:aspartyl-tRNA(Asn)/glutamyl-tRNA(Gln) amidotransferase subunit B